MTSTMPSFTRLVHALPPELFNYIKNLVLTPQKGAITIRSDYKLLKFLQISSFTKKQYAKDLYGPGTTLQFEDFGTLRKYLPSLTKSHRRLIDRVELMVNAPVIQVIDTTIAGRFYQFQQFGPPALSTIQYVELKLLSVVRDKLRLAGGNLKPKVIHMAYSTPVDASNQMSAFAGLEEWWKVVLVECNDKTPYLEESLSSDYHAFKSNGGGHVTHHQSTHLSGTSKSALQAR